jgi:putative cell wall-binding protein
VLFGAFSVDLARTVTDVGVDSYSAQVIAASNGLVQFIDEFSEDVTGYVDLPGATKPMIDVDATRSLVWALDTDHATLYRIDERTHTVTGTVAIPGGAADVAVDHATSTVFVTTGAGGTVVPVDGSTLHVGTAVPVAGTPTQLGVDTAAGTLYAVDSTAHTVAVIAEATGTVTGTVALPGDVASLAVDSAHHKAYLGSATAAAVTVIDGVALTSAPATVPADAVSGITALGIDPTTQTVVGRHGDRLFRIDTTTAQTVSTQLGGDRATVPTIVADVFTNSVFYAGSTALTGLWEPVSLLGSASAVVAAGNHYSQQLTAWSGYNAAITFSVTGGALPPGLTLSGDTISGTASGPGTYTFSLTASTPSTGDSVTQTYTLRVVTVNRTAGADRFATSVEVSKASYPDPSTVGTVYVANGISFPDALSGGPAAAQKSGPLLLTAPGYLPSSVHDEIARLHPSKIVVVGGPAVVGDAVVRALEKLVPTAADVERVYGGDRFATSRAVIQDAFDTAPTVYVSTGLNFPDSLSAGGAAGSLHAPLLLVNGNAGAVDQATKSLLDSLGTTKVVVIGGAAVMSPALVQDFSQYWTVVHLAGADRFESSQQVVESAFSTSDRVILANGLNFPDALGASAWSGKSASPLFITRPSCVPQGALDDTFFLGATKVTLIGGATVLDSGAAGLISCGGYSVIAPAYPASAPTVTSKAVTAFGSGGPVGQPVAPLLRVGPRAEGPAGR